MDRWEYHTENVVVGHRNVDKWLNEMGQKGWELCGINYFVGGFGGVREFYFKRRDLNPNTKLP